MGILKGGTDPNSQHLNNQKSKSQWENREIPNIDVFDNPNSIFHSLIPVQRSAIRGKLEEKQDLENQKKKK